MVVLSLHNRPDLCSKPPLYCIFSLSSSSVLSAVDTPAQPWFTLSRRLHCSPQRQTVVKSPQGRISWPHADRHVQPTHVSAGGFLNP